MVEKEEKQEKSVAGRDYPILPKGTDKFPQRDFGILDPEEERDVPDFSEGVIGEMILAREKRDATHYYIKCLQLGKTPESAEDMALFARGREQYEISVAHNIKTFDGKTVILNGEIPREGILEPKSRKEIPEPKQRAPRQSELESKAQSEDPSDFLFSIRRKLLSEGDVMITQLLGKKESVNRGQNFRVLATYSINGSNICYTHTLNGFDIGDSYSEIEEDAFERFKSILISLSSEASIEKDRKGYVLRRRR